MDLRTTAGLGLIAGALILASVMLASAPEDERDGNQTGFLSVPGGKADWLRLLLVALFAYVVSIQLFVRFGYTIPLVQRLRFEIVFVYPLVLLAAASVVALFVERRLGIVFSVLSALAAAATVLHPPL